MGQVIQFSIILPVRNGGEYIKECIASILSQTYPHFNLIILDSGSIDDTISYIESLHDEHIVLHKSEKPLSIEENWSRIKDIKKNEFITLIGHDDLLAANYLDVMNELITKHPEASLYQAHFNLINSTGDVIRVCTPMDEIQKGDEFLSMLLVNHFDIMGTGFMMRSSHFDSIGGMPDYPNLLYADYHLFLLLTGIAYKATAFESCFSYRIHNSTVRASADAKILKAFERFVFFLNELQGQGKNYNEAIRRYCSKFLITFCKSQSHRLIRTPALLRDNFFVARLIEQCKGYSNLLNPDIPFDPEDIFSIKLARLIDSTKLTRWFFLLFKKIIRKPIL